MATENGVNGIAHVDVDLINTSLPDRIAYLSRFLGFGPQDLEILTEIAPIARTLVPGLVDGVYEHLFSFDVTKRVFLNRNEGFDGELPTKLEDLHLDSEQILFRKNFLRMWGQKVFTPSLYENGKIFEYLDKVGLMHTGEQAFKHHAKKQPLHVAFRDCSILLYWVQDAVQSALLGLPEETLPMPKKIAAVSAINKLMAIQSDLFSRHYIGPEKC